MTLPFRKGARVQLSNGEFATCRCEARGVRPPRWQPGARYWEIATHRGPHPLVVVDDNGAPLHPDVPWRVTDVCPTPPPPQPLLSWEDEFIGEWTRNDTQALAAARMKVLADIEAREAKNAADTEAELGRWKNYVPGPRPSPRWGDETLRMLWDPRWPVRK